MTNKITYTLKTTISFCSLFALLLQPNLRGVLYSAVITFIVFLAYKKHKPQLNSTTPLFRKKNILISAFLFLTFGVLFTIGWAELGAVKSLFPEPIVRYSLVTIPALVFSLLSSYMLSPLTNTLSSCLSKTNHSTEKSKTKLWQYLFIGVTAVVTITICSKSSPIYPFNDWLDANCFFTVGKSVANGQILYKDIYEQKGPLLYFIHSLTYQISNTTFLGVYFAEILSAFAFLLISYKTMRLFCGEKSIFFIPMVSLLAYASVAFCHGDSAEEFILPLISYGLYVGIKFLLTENKIKYTECLFIGLTSGAVLWIKFNLLGFYLGFIIIPLILYIKKRQLKELFISIGSIVTGIVLISVPILTYFISNNALSDLFTAYFYNNLFLYSNKSSANPIINLISNLAKGLTIFDTAFYICLAVIIFTIAVLLINGKKKLCGFVVITFATMFLPIFMGKAFPYYAFIFSVFIPIGVALVVNYLSSMQLEVASKTSRNVDITNPSVPDRFPAIFCTVKKEHLQCIGAIFAVFCLLFQLFLTPNRYLKSYSKEDMPQYKFNEIISQKENPTLLNYGFLDGGFYTVSNIIPNCKYFCQLNIPLEKMMETQDYYVEKGLTDFVVTMDEELVADNYRFVSDCTFIFEEQPRTYRLYSKLNP